jgi:hypothetical protein
MTFRPEAVMIGTEDEVELVISASAEDNNGNDLDGRFSARYNAAAETTPFRIDSYSLRYSGGTIEVSGTDAPDSIDIGKYPELPSSVTVCFSEPPARSDLVTAISVSPRMRYRLKFRSRERLEITLLPDTAKQNCRLSISKILESERGGSLSAGLELSLGPGLEVFPEITGIAFTNGFTGEETEMEPHVLNSGVEKNAVMAISLSKEITAAELPAVPGSFLAINPAADFTLVPAGVVPASEWTLSFINDLEPGCFYNLVSDEKSWSFVVDGPDSIPPAVEGVFWCGSLAESGSFSEVFLNDTVAFDAAPDAALDIVVSGSADAGVPLSSFIEAFSIGWTNSCLTADIRKIEKIDPAPVYAGEGNEVFRLLIGLEENLNSGIVEVSLSNKLSDGLGNRMRDNYSFKLNK